MAERALQEHGLPPKRKKIRLEMVDDDGDRITLMFEGRLTREKILQLADFLELYGGGEEAERSLTLENKLTKLARLVEKNFPLSAFTSKDVLETYVSEYGENIPLSTVSTYLSRLAERGFLERVGGSGTIKYRLARARAEELEDS